MKSSMADFFTDVWKSIVGFLGSFNWIVDTLDILLVAFIIYSAIKLVRDSRAEQLLKGIILLLVMFGVAKLLHMKALDFLLQTVFNSSLLLLAIIFQPEIRKALENLGQKNFLTSFLRLIFQREKSQSLRIKRSMNW